MRIPCPAAKTLISEVSHYYIRFPARRYRYNPPHTPGELPAKSFLSFKYNTRNFRTGIYSYSRLKSAAIFAEIDNFHIKNGEKDNYPSLRFRLYHPAVEPLITKTGYTCHIFFRLTITVSQMPYL